MKYPRQVMVTAGLLHWLGIAIVGAQTIELPTQSAKDPEATVVAGIGSYNLSHEHGAVDEHGVVASVAVQALDVEGQPLAHCEIEWLGESKVMACRMPDGESFQATWFADRVEFEDLGMRDHLSLRVEGGSSLRAAELGFAKSRPGRGEWVLRGTKTMAEVEQDWGHVTPIFGYLLAEVEVTLRDDPGRSALPRSTHPSVARAAAQARGLRRCSDLLRWQRSVRNHRGVRQHCECLLRLCLG